MFSVEQLRHLYTRWIRGRFGGSRQLGKAQSVISQHIINLGNDCNATLFERTGRYPQLTQARHKLSLMHKH
ncbi:helix-turn-helix domain-containing protein (plasmid) [Pseudoalteromonas espejiana]